MVVFLLILALAYFGGSYFAYNALRRKYAGIIGIPGSYFILLTAFLVIGLIRGIFTGGFGESALELILTILIMLAGIAYTVLMILRCETLADKILLPIAAILIGSGFCIRVIPANRSVCIICQRKILISGRCNNHISAAGCNCIYFISQHCPRTCRRFPNAAVGANTVYIIVPCSRNSFAITVRTSAAGINYLSRLRAVSSFL